MSVRRPYVFVNFAMSLDGALDDTSSTRLILSNDEDFDYVDELRAGCDAIAIGANTVRNDNPRLVLHSQARREARLARGLPVSPHKVIFSQSGGFDESSRIFGNDATKKIVIVPGVIAEREMQRLAKVAEVIGAGDEALDIPSALLRLANIGVERLFVEGGPTLLQSFFALGVVDEVRIAIAPIEVGDDDAPNVDLEQDPFRSVLESMHHSYLELNGMRVSHYRFQEKAVMV